MGEETLFSLRTVIQIGTLVASITTIIAYMRQRIGVVERDVVAHADKSEQGMLRLDGKLDTMLDRMTTQGESIIRIEGYGKVADERHRGYERRAGQIESRIARLEDH